ncbi:MAG: zeta toxin family protein, partial [Planctomycetaceae bacterium]|nr:zeta toxin family protein [Planctomycetaceae bacterium]
MKIHQLLDHYGVKINPFSQEDAQSDHIFQRHCAEVIYHPAWDKVLGDCENPSTSIVFGEKGAGKTALRLQLVNALRTHNRSHPDERAFVISYDDLNPFLDTFRDRLRGRKRQPDHALQEWRLWDHMDALLTLSTRRLCNVLADETFSDPDLTVEQFRSLPRLRKRDLLMLAAFYDYSSDQSHWRRWKAIRKKLGFFSPLVHWRAAVGFLVTAVTLFLALKNIRQLTDLAVLKEWWLWLVIGIGWLPWLRRSVSLWWLARQIVRQVRILEHGVSTMRRILANFPARELDGQPMPSRDRSDDRYELLAKLQRILT